VTFDLFWLEHPLYGFTMKARIDVYAGQQADGNMLAGLGTIL
jgi:hypothetical protein